MGFFGDTGRYLEMTILLKAVNSTGPAFSNVALAATAMAATIGAGLAYSVKAAADFQQGVTVLATGAGEARDKLQMVGDGIKQISIDTGTSTDQLLKGMFMIESGGYHAQAGLDILKVAAQGSRNEHADLGKTAFALTGLLHDYGMNSTQAASAMNGLIATESAGKMKMQDLTTSLGNVLPLASALGISFPQIGAAIAVMTNSNMMALRATQNLNFALRALEAPGNTALSAMQMVGLSSDEVIKTLSGPNGLADALTLIEDHVAKTFPAGTAEFNAALKDIMGGATGWNVAVKLSGQHLQELEKDTKNITDAMSNASAGVKNWDLTQSTFNFKLDQMKSGLSVAAIDLGTLLLPALEQVMSAVVPLISQFTNWVETSQGLHTAIQNIGNFLAGTLVPALANGAQAIGNFVQGAIGLYQAFQQGQPQVMAIATALTSIGVAIAAIKILEFAAGIAKSLAQFKSLTDMVVTLASKALPNLAAALGWNQTQADRTSAAMARLGLATTAQGTAATTAAAQTIAANAQMSQSVQMWATEASAASETYVEDMALAKAATDAVTVAEREALQVQAEADAAMDAAMAKWQALSVIMRQQADNINAGTLPAAVADQQAQELAMLQQEALDRQAVADAARVQAQASRDAAAAAVESAAASEAAASQSALAVKTAMAEEEASIEGAVAAEVAASTAAAAGMTLALGAATMGISLLVGAAIVGFAQAAANGQNALTTTLQQAKDQLDSNTADMVAKQKAAYGDTRAAILQTQLQSADTAAKQKADAVTVASYNQASASDSSRAWQSSGRQTQIASGNMKAQMILDQQAIADAAAKDAAAAANSWSDFIAQMHGMGIDPINGGKWDPTTPAAPQRGRVAPPNTNNTNQSWNVGHASGILNSPYGHFAMVGERGPELMYVPKGSNIYPNGTGPGGTTINVHVSTMAGSRAEVSRMVDLIERELAGRFRSQTPNFGYGGSL